MLIPSSIITPRSGNLYLQGSVASCCADLDATIAASYGGSGQTWANLIAAPADSAAQSAYDFYLGATSGSSTDDPAFTGSPGSSAAYWACDGGDFFQIAAGNTTLLKDAHKTTGGGDVTMVMVFKSGSTLANSPCFGNANAGASHGFDSLTATTGTAFKMAQYNGTTGATTGTLETIAASTDYVVAVAFNYTSGTLKTALNARVFTNRTIASNVDTTDATNAFKIGGAGTGIIPTGYRIYSFSLFNALLSDANLSSVIDAYNARHGRAYA